MDESARGGGRGTDNIGQPRQRGRDENGIENHQTNLLPLSRVLVTSTPVRAHTYTRTYMLFTYARNSPPARLTLPSPIPRFSARMRTSVCPRTRNERVLNACTYRAGSVRASRVHETALPFK